MTAVVPVSLRGSRSGGFKYAGRASQGTRGRGGGNRSSARQAARRSFRDSPTAEPQITTLTERSRL